MSDKPTTFSMEWSRRALLLGAIAAAGAATAVDVSSAADALKISESAVGYQDHPSDDKQCSDCLNFLPPGSCKVVDGAISPHGYCRIFAPRQSASR